MVEKRRSPTMEDVARLAGVNRVTVSVVLNNAKANTQVSEATRKRILEAARQVGYHRNARALALRRQVTDIIGFYAGYNPNLHDPFTAEVLNAIQLATITAQKDLLVLGDHPGRSANSVFGLLMSGKIDGLVMIPAPHNPLMDEFADSHRPVVAIADALPRLPSVVVDDTHGSQLLAHYLAEKGHRRILYRADHQNHVSARTRLEAFQAAAVQLGIQVQAIPTEDPGAGLSPEEEALLAVSNPSRPTTVVCWADTNAFECVEGCLRMGLRIPDDIAVAGFDGIQTRIRPAIQLTTIRAPWREVTVKAVELLDRLMSGEEVPRLTVFPVELLVGETA